MALPKEKNNVAPNCSLNSIPTIVGISPGR